MKVASLVSAVDPAVGGGVSEAVINLNKNLNKLNEVFTKIYSLKNIKSNIDSIPGLDISLQKFYDPFLYGFSPSLKKEILNSESDLLHSNGMWEYLSKITLSWKKKGGEYIVTPQGMLNPWAMNNSKLKKKILYNLIDKEYIQKASVLHAVNFHEYKSIREFGFKNPVCIIPNGVSLPVIERKTNTDISNLLPAKKILLYIGRIHPVKGLDYLLKALHELKVKNDNFLNNWIFQVAGWGRKNHVSDFEKKIHFLNLNNEVKYLGPLFNKNKHRILKMADAFILPSLNEGLPIAVLEAWSYSLPVLMSPYCNIPEGFSNEAAIEIWPDVESIVSGLKKLSCFSNDELLRIGENGKILVETNFNWEKIAKNMKEVYEWILGKREKPDCVVVT